MLAINLFSLRFKSTFLSPALWYRAEICKHFSFACWHKVRLCQIEGTGGALQDDISRKTFPFWVLVLLPYFYSVQVLIPSSAHLYSPHWPVPAIVSGLVLPTLRLLLQTTSSCPRYLKLQATCGPTPACVLWQVSSPWTSKLCIPVVAILFSKMCESKPVRG